MWSKNKSSQLQNKMLPLTHVEWSADRLRDAAEYFMIMRHIDLGWVAGFTSRLLYSSAVQSRVT